MEKNTCCICGKELVGYGNNPSPVKEEGQCCNVCNIDKVIPARIAQVSYRHPVTIT